MNHLQIFKTIAKQNMELGQRKAKERFDIKAKVPDFKVSDRVLLRCNATKPGLSSKLSDKWDGPYVIVDLGTKFTYKLRNCKTNQVLKSLVNAKRLKHFHERLLSDSSDSNVSPDELSRNDHQSEHNSDPKTSSNEQSHGQPEIQPDTNPQPVETNSPQSTEASKTVETESPQIEPPKPVDDLNEQSRPTQGPQVKPNAGCRSTLWKPDRISEGSYSAKGRFFRCHFTGGLRLSFILLGCLILGFPVPSASTGMIPRLNYGVIFQREASITLSREYWLHTFEITLPKHVSFPTIGPCYKDKETCKIISHVLSQLNSVRIETGARLNNTLQTIHKLVPHADIVKKSRSRRSLLPFIGKFSRTLFGTATVDDVNILANHINALMKRERSIADALVQHGQHLSSFMATSNNRMDNLLQGVKENHLAIEYIENQVRHNARNIQETFQDMTSLLVSQLQVSNTLNHELDELKLGRVDLANGKLSPLIIPLDILQATLNDVHSILVSKYTGFFVAIKSAAEMYHFSNFLYTRNKPVTKDSCVLALFSNNRDNIQKFCNFRFVHDAIKSQVIDLGLNKVLLYDSQVLSMECNGKHQMIHGCNFCIFDLPCQCSLSSTKYYLPPRLVSCKNTSVEGSTKLHPVNLILLQRFFDNEKYQHIFADTTFASPLNITVPTFRVYKHEMSNILADDVKNHLNLTKMVEVAKNDDIVFQTLAEPILDGHVTLPTTWPDLNGILNIISLVYAVVVTLVLFWVYRKLGKLASTVAVLQQVTNGDNNCSTLWEVTSIGNVN
ncbi:Y068-like protein [Mya arenaria]|uniref:Y068-like protein n=1 Tax=Mya arenaria TaxID=6604 RepID=A0ABY7FG50_MYAAR|nr:Y068-like protein [Mya arenaria]